MLEDGHATTHTTIEDALSHRSGLPRHDLMYGQPNDTPSSVVQRIQYLPMTAEPRTTFQYCNIMFGVITDLIETITGRKLEAILDDNIWKPLGMLSTSFTLPSTTGEDSRLARGYYWDPHESQHVPEPYLDIFPISGAGATISTVNDYALWIRALLDAAGGDNTRNKSSPVTYRMFHDIVTPRTIVSDSEEDEEPNKLDFITPLLYALGWLVTDVEGETVIAHDGGLTGFGANVYMLPRKSYGIITMANTAGTSNIVGNYIATYLLEQKLNWSTTYEAPESKVLKSLQKISKATLHPSIARTHRRTRVAEDQVPSLQNKGVPLRGSIANYAGLYSHPAYGTINLTIADSRSESIPSKTHARGLDTSYLADKGPALPS